jgi:hypothetical protein
MSDHEIEVVVQGTTARCCADVADHVRAGYRRPAEQTYPGVPPARWPSGLGPCGPDNPNAGAYWICTTPVSVSVRGLVDANGTGTTKCTVVDTE